MRPPSDEDLFERGRSGDRASLGELLNRMEPELARTLDINPRHRPLLAPEDVIQVTFLEVMLDIHRAPGTLPQFRRWVAAILRNNLRDAIEWLERIKRRRPDGPADPDAGSWSHLYMVVTGSSTGPPTRTARQEFCERIKPEIDQLPDDYRRVICMLHYNGLTVPQAATEMARREGAIHMLRKRAIDRLKQRLGGGD